MFVFKEILNLFIGKAKKLELRQLYKRVEKGEP